MSFQALNTSAARISAADTLNRGRGDCEDYALLKYALLREAGFAEDDLRLAIVRLPLLQQDHAVLAVRLEGRWLVLDNRRFAMLDARDYADEALFVLGGDTAQLRQAQTEAGAGLGALPLVL